VTARTARAAAYMPKNNELRGAYPIARYKEILTAAKATKFNISRRVKRSSDHCDTART